METGISLAGLVKLISYFISLDEFPKLHILIYMPAISLKMNDSTMSGKVQETWTIAVVFDRATVREIIEIRVKREVEKYNENCSQYFQGLVQPDETEKTLNGYKMRNVRTIDASEQCKKAIEGYEKNSFILLANDKQTEFLEQIIEINENTEITFIKLIPLVGG